MLCHRYRDLKSSKEWCHTLENLLQLYSPPLKGKTQGINKRFSRIHRIVSLHEAAKSAARQETDLEHLLHQCYSIILAGIPDMPLE